MVVRLDVSLPHFVDEMFACAPGKSHDGERGVFVRVAAESGSVVEEEVGHFPTLVPAVGDGL
jgi:hypothetical protein